MQFTPRFENYEIGTIGQPLPGYSVKLLDENQNPVPDGTVGELWIQGDSMASCYWKQTHWSHYSFVGPWFRTGDMVVKLPSGNYQYVSRRDDYIKIDGQWVAANEIESALLSIPGIDDAAVIFEVSNKELPKIHAFVVTGNAPLDQQFITLCLANTLPRFKIPKHYHFIDSIPKTLTNKKTKYVLSTSLNITELSRETV
jgi:acyl-coenzyme A synthetase/AMP-(fatty) acid ligase